MKDRLPKNLVLCLVSFFFILLVLEMSLRLYGYDRLSALRNGREMILQPSTHPILKYELRPGASGWAWSANVDINSHGFRGPEPLPGTY